MSDTKLERVAQAMLDDIGNANRLDMTDPYRRVITIQLSSADLVGMAEAAVSAAEKYKQPALTVDCVVFDPTGRLLLIQRKHPPFQGQYALPGGFVEDGETTEAAAARELLEETGLVVESLRLIGVYSEPDRDPRQHVISVAYLVTVTHYNPQAGDDAATAEFLECDSRLAFDHDKIVNDAMRFFVE